MDNKYELNNVTYVFSTMPPTTALPLMTKLGSLLSGVANVELGDSLSGTDIESEASKIKLGVVIAKAIASSMATLSPKSLMEIADTCKDFISVDGEKCIIDVAFIGKLPDMFKVIGSFLRFTYGDFFPESIVDFLKSKMPSM